MVPRLSNTPLVLTVLSPLAEGADRLVAQEVLKFPGSMLEVIIPMRKNEYLQDFTGTGSKQEFEQLLSQAVSVRRVSFEERRPEAYGLIGRYIVEQCDVLIALWDGDPAAGEGGTADIVDYARTTGCPLIWINTRMQGQVTCEMGKGINRRAFVDIDEYNSRQLDNTVFEKQVNEFQDALMSEAAILKLDCDKAKLIFKHFAHHLIRADMLAARYQHLYYWTESMMYILALLAIVVAAAQILFWPKYPLILILEIGLMAAVLIIFFVSQRNHWHDKWIDARFLAERFRAALFLAAADTEIATLRPPRHLSLAYSSRDWIVAAFSAVWSQRPRATIEDSSWDSIRRLIGKAWIEDQIRYHDIVSEQQHQRHKNMIVVSYVLFGLTILAALLHIFEVGSNTVETIFAFMAVVLPAIAASITAIRTHRDYLRKSMRSAEMARHLKEIQNRLTRVEDYSSFRDLLRETDETMLHENEDWRVVVRFNTPEVPA